MAVDFWVNPFILEFEKYFTQHFILFLFQGSRAEIAVKAGKSIMCNKSNSRMMGRIELVLVKIAKTT
jgi:hypothetical protein